MADDSPVREDLSSRRSQLRDRDGYYVYDQCASRRPYRALQCLPGTELVLTLTGGMRSAIKNDRRLRLVKAPQELQAFHFLMAWHPRLNSDPRHVWLRGAMRSTAASLDR
jgi:hypothetical protein